MFGYIRTDEPFLYKKDETLYNACYCGLCFAIKKLCGQKARLSLTYDVAFLSVLLHNLSDADVEIENKKCAVHPFKKRKIAKTDEVFLSCAALNVILAYYNAMYDIDDEKSSGIKNALKKSIVKKGYYKAKKVYPEIDDIFSRCYKSLAEKEKGKCDSPDIVADDFSVAAKESARFILGEKYTDEVGETFYFLGKWIYLIDALDDYDKDKTSGNYNVFFCLYGEENGKELIKKHGEEIFQLLNFVFFRLKENLGRLTFYFNKDLIENVLVRGIPKVTDGIIKKYLSANCDKCGKGAK